MCNLSRNCIKMSDPKNRGNQERGDTRRTVEGERDNPDELIEKK